jgi:hypothetical protein
MAAIKEKETGFAAVGLEFKKMGPFFMNTIEGGVSFFGDLFSWETRSKADISGTDDPIVPRPCLFDKPPAPTPRKKDVPTPQ